MLLEINSVGRLLVVECKSCGWKSATPHPHLLGFLVYLHLRECFYSTEKKPAQSVRYKVQLKRVQS